METIKSKHIINGLVVGFILFLFYLLGQDGYTYQHPGANTQGTTPPHPSHPTFDSERTNPTTSTGSYNSTNPQRNVLLQTNVKGYREETYWGEQHPIDEKVRDMSDYEFDRYIDEVEENDADVYWGATY
jgi:hypothetical protein